MTSSAISQLTIRPARLEEIPQLQQLIALSVRGLSAGYYTPAQIESALKYVFGIDSQLVIDGTYFVAQKGQVIVGCGGWSKRNTLFGGDQHKEVEDPLLNPQTDAARIRAFFVHPEYARQGIGKQIMLFCENEAIHHGFKALELGATLPGVPLYEAMGYVATERIDVPMADGELLRIVKMRKMV